MKRKLIAAILLIMILYLAGCASPAEHISTSANRPDVTNTRSASPSKEVSNTAAPGNLRVHFIDVGQGDCELVQLPDGQNMLIDAGTNDAGPTVVSYLKSIGITKIDYLIGTHPHEDHIGGMDNVVASFSIGKIYMPRVTTTTATFEDLLKAIQAKNLKIITAKAGIKIADKNGLQITLLAPCKTNYEELNDWSAVTKVQFKNTSFLFTGDAQEQSENEMLSSGTNLKADVLKVGHHGSHSSTSNSFLKAVSPKYAVISVGAGNDYGHPHQVTLDKLTAAGIKTYRTDENGTVVMVSDGTNISVKTLGKAIKPRAPNTGAVTTSTEPVTNAINYIGNTNSKKFHRPDCSSLPAPHNRVYFKTRNEAISTGYSPCKLCNP